MKQRYIDYGTYNIWANKRLISDLQAHDDSILTAEHKGSYPTIRATLMHIWYAEVGWLSRMKGEGWKTNEVANFQGSNQELYTSWLEKSQEFLDFVGECDLEKGIRFNHKGNSFDIPCREIIQTVFNHGSYHRGQVVMMLRQLGVSSIKQTDYIEWVRQKALGETNR